MNLLFITAHKYLPQMRGGLQTSTDELCAGLLTRGHRVSVLAGLMSGDLTAYACRVNMHLHKWFTGYKISKDMRLGYPVWRSWFPWQDVQYVAGEEKPDLIVVMAIEPVRMALAARPLGVPIVMQLMDVEFKDHGGPFEALGHIPCIANSVFTAATYRDAYGVDPVVIYPFIDPAKYETATTRRTVTFINPVHEKGLDIAISVARLCPDLPFTFVEGWPLPEEKRIHLRQELAELPNIIFLPSQSDMRKVYGITRILLAPSQWAEAYGRVATEAQFSGIPVVASNRGGLPEAVGPGGIVLDPAAPMQEWASAVRKLWSDQDYYEQLSGEAKAYSNRPALSYPVLLNQMEEVFKNLSRT